MRPSGASGGAEMIMRASPCFSGITSAGVMNFSGS